MIRLDFDVDWSLLSPHLAELHPPRHEKLLEHHPVLAALSGGNTNSAGPESLPIIDLASPQCFDGLSNLRNDLVSQHIVC